LIKHSQNVRIFIDEWYWIRNGIIPWIEILFLFRKTSTPIISLLLLFLVLSL